MKYLIFIIRFAIKYWQPLLCFSAGIIFNAYMDHLDFHVAHDQGFWSLHTVGSRFDAWHVSKVAMLACFALGMINEKYKWRFKLTILGLFGLINYFLHNLFFHKIFRRG